MSAHLLSPGWSVAVRVLSFACVIAVYGLAIAATMRPVDQPIVEDETAGAFFVELAPITTSIPTPPIELPVGPPAIDAADTPPSAPATEHTEPIVDPDLPKLPTVTDATDTLTVAKPIEKPPEEPKEETKPNERTPDAPVVAPSTASVAAASPKVENVPVSPKSTARQAGTSSRDRRAIASWKASLVLHLNRFKRYPAAVRGAELSKPIDVRFTLDRAGRVLDAAVVNASGIAPLDKEARDMVLRASPLPRPPAASPGEVHVFVVPVLFKRR